MTVSKLNRLRSLVRNIQPLIHSITNPISINQCANTVLAVGAQPIMAEHPDEVKEITLSSKALLLNLGNITDVRIKSMLISAAAAKENNIPFVLDAVGVACSEFRRNFALNLIENITPTVIKGNYSEINALNSPIYKSSGVDADNSLTTKTMSYAAIQLSQKYNSVILASGKTDIITDGKKIVYIKNGTPQLARITGTGCMLGALCACFLPVSSPFEAAITACATLGICGELSESDNGNGSFMIKLIDNLSVLSDRNLEKHLTLEEEKIEIY